MRLVIRRIISQAARLKSDSRTKSYKNMGTASHFAGQRAWDPPREMDGSEMRQVSGIRRFAPVALALAMLSLAACALSTGKGVETAAPAAAAQPSGPAAVDGTRMRAI